MLISFRKYFDKTSEKIIDKVFKETEIIGYPFNPLSAVEKVVRKGIQTIKKVDKEDNNRLE